MEKKTTVEYLQDSIDTFRKRNAIYKDNFKDHGKKLLPFFENGIELKTSDDFLRFSLFSTCVEKLARYAKQFDNGGHEDSLEDLSAYAAMLREVDNDIRQQ